MTPPTPLNASISRSGNATSQIRHVESCPIKPESPQTPTRCDLAAWDVPFLTVSYIQKGLLFSIPTISDDVDDIVDQLQTSLSAALLHFYPLAGRLVTERVPDQPNGLFTYIDCSKGGAEFVRAVADGISVADVLQPSRTPKFVWDFFPVNGAINHDGHTQPLLAVQLTELSDGIFLGCTFSHVIGDGSSFWNFIRGWSEICRGINPISRPPVHNRWFIDNTSLPIALPLTTLDGILHRFIPPTVLQERMFHFPASSIVELKQRANDQFYHNRGLIGSKGPTISSLKALSGLVWRCITRARHLSEMDTTHCRLACNNRPRLSPPLSPYYFGNCVSVICFTTTVSELMEHDLGWASTMLHDTVVSWTDAKIREGVEKWMTEPEFHGLRNLSENSVIITSSPRFDVYGCDFGWGKAMAVRSGSANKFDGKVTTFPGREGGGSVDLEICLELETMKNLELDEEFMSAISHVGLNSVCLN